MHIHFIIHESYEGPAAFEEWVVRKGFKQSSTHLYKGDKLPSVLNFDHSHCIRWSAKPQNYRC